MSLLHVKDLSITFKSDEKETPAVQEVSFSVERGQIVGLIGESGSGKTAIADAIMGFQPKNAHLSGEIFFDERSLVNLSEKEMQKLRGKKLSMIFQDPMTALNPTWRIESQLIEAIRIHHKISRAEARLKSAALLEKVGIENSLMRMQSYPHELSGGLRQRMVIALALINSPDLIIADELTTALDTTTKVKLARLLRELQSSFNSAFLIISHDLSFVKNLCDEICVLYSGRVAEIAPTSQLFERPQHPYTEALLNALPAYAQAKNQPLKPIPGTITQPTPKHQGCPFYERCPHAMAECAKAPPPMKKNGASEAACLLVQESELLHV